MNLKEIVTLNDNRDIYYALLDFTQKLATEKVSNESKKKLYYISAEFLIGKLLSNNLINLGIYDEVKSFSKKTEKVWQTLKPLNQSHRLEMADLVVWQPVSLILSPHLV